MILLEITGPLFNRIFLFFGRHPTGIERVFLEYIKHYRHQSRAVLAGCFIFTEPYSEKIYDWILKPTSKFALLWIIIKGISNSLFTSSPLPGSFFINVGNVFSFRKRLFSRMIAKKHFRPIIMVHDLIPITHPEYCISGEKHRQLNRMRIILEYSTGIICNSKATQDELIKLSIKEKIPIPPSIDALLAPGMKKSISNAPIKLKSPYFVFLATIDPRKNHYMILHIWRKMIKELKDRTPHLIIIGQRGFSCEHVNYMLKKCNTLKRFVTRISNCNDTELEAWLYHAKALLFPSFCEGYGLPLAEALSMGIPVIASNLPVFKEIAGDVPEYIDPLDGKEWEKIIIEYASQDSQLRAAQLNRMKDLSLSTWKEHFAKVDTFITGLR